MLMMNELIDKLHIEQCSLVLLHEGNIRTFEGRGVRMLYNLLNEVYADVISEEAHNRLKDAGIKVDYDKKVNHQRFLEIWKQMGEIKD